jgi:plastocyanin
MVGLIVTGLILSAVTAAHVAAVGVAAVDIKEFAYTPPTLAVPVGTTVRWVNHDEEPHTITSVSGAFGSAGLSHDDAFAQEGIYVSFNERLDAPASWSTPLKIIDGGGWYPQVIGLERPNGTDRWATTVARFFMSGASDYFIEFSRAE